MDGKLMTISMTEAELALYQSGQRRGHAECLQQLSGQLRGAAKQQRASENEAESRINPDDGTTSYSAVPIKIAEAYEIFAAQLDEPATQASKEQQLLLDRWCVLRVVDSKSVLTRLKCAYEGALAGWRGR